ncbi:MAG: HAD-IIIA family hydrolase [Bacteriovoracaceae bacterium]|nr:HAD-IIIA family hydrolase [Bacteriovoracaceae bacterium]
MFIYLASQTSTPSETERNFREYLEANFTNSQITIVRLNEQKVTLAAPGILFTSSKVENRSINELSADSDRCYVDYSPNDGRPFAHTDDNDKISKIGPLDSEHHDGLYPLGIYSFTKDSTVEHLIKSTGLKITPLPLRNPLSPLTPCLFMDRDGIINVDTGYLHKAEDLTIKPGVEKVIKFFNERKWPVICITNQSGVARGMFDCDAVNILHDEINQRLSIFDCHIDHFEIAPYYYAKGVGEYKKYSVLRKPGPGMVLKCHNLFNIDHSRSIMIGDKNSDCLHFFHHKTLLLQGQYDLSSRYGIILNSFDEVMQQLREFYKSNSP